MLAISTCVALLLTLQVSCTLTNMDSKAIASSIAKFSAKFVNELEKGKSVVSSPLSAEFVLALLTLGTTEPAHSELLSALGFSDDDSIRSSFSNVSAKLKGLKGVTFDVANKVYINDGGYELQQELEKDAVKIFDAAMEKLNFSNSAASASTINGWVEEKTNKKIKDLFSSDSFDARTRLVLVNALYFKGTWKNQFDPSFTEEQAFYLNADSTVQVPMMFKEDQFAYGFSEQLQAQFLELPYVGDEASMLIVLPNEIDGLNEVVTKLAGGYDLMSDLEKMFKTKVRVSIPKFKIETEIDLKEVLPKLGINAIFDESNSGITKLLNTDEALFVSKAIQKAFIEVNEEGAEAAAATAMGIALLSAMVDLSPVQTFVADRPFLAVIVVDGAPCFWASYNADEE